MQGLWKISLSFVIALTKASGGESNLPIAGTSTSAVQDIRLRTLYDTGTASASGAVIEVRLQQSAKPVRVLLDTGARDVLLGAKAAERIGLRGGGGMEPKTNAVVRGFSGEAAGTWQDSVRVQFSNGLILEDVRVQVMAEGRRVLQRDVDGLIGLNVFSDFLVELDNPRGRLRLHPRNEDPAASGWVPWEQAGHLLLVRTECNGREIGWALLDTGSSFSAVDLGKAQAINGPAADREFVALRGVTGTLEAGSYRLSPVQFGVAGAPDQFSLLDPAPLAVNLGELGARHGVQIGAVIGFPAISRATVQLDYRGRRLRIVPNR